MNEESTLSLLKTFCGWGNECSHKLQDLRSDPQHPCKSPYGCGTEAEGSWSSLASLYSQLVSFRLVRGPASKIRWREIEESTQQWSLAFMACSRARAHTHAQLSINQRETCIRIPDGLLKTSGRTSYSGSEYIGVYWDTGSQLLGCYCSASVQIGRPILSLFMLMFKECGWAKGKL